MLQSTPEFTISNSPDRLIMFVPGLNPGRARTAALLAVQEARRNGPKNTGQSMSRLQPLYGKNFFGLSWQDSYVWFQEHGIKAFTMNSLQGKTIPMWINDPTGKERAKNPKAKTRTTMSGVTQVLIFRKAALKGTRITKYKTNQVTGQKMVVSDKPASYPGAPGRINTRESASPDTTAGRVAGAVARGNIGVRWRHPGLEPRLFLNNGCTIAAQKVGVLPVRIYVADRNWRASVHGAEYDA